MVLWDEVFEEVKTGYPDVKTDRMLVDAMAARFVTDPASIDTVVATNLHADILSDLAAALAGGLGIAPTGNVNPERAFPSMFEPIHGSAFDIMGRGIANPLGSFWSAVLMLDHLGEREAGARLMRAIETVTREGRALTRDLGGQATTAQATRAVIAALDASDGRIVTSSIHAAHPSCPSASAWWSWPVATTGGSGCAYGGDTFNTAVYLARAGIDVSYATALGDDPYSAGLIALARREDVDTGLIATVSGPHARPVPHRDGERRAHVPLLARPLAGARAVRAAASRQHRGRIASRRRRLLFRHHAVAVFGIGPRPFRRRLAARRARPARSSSWTAITVRAAGPDAGRAREVISRFWSLADIALPTFDDEAQLWGDADPQATADRLFALGVGEIAVKLGSAGALAGSAGAWRPLRRRPPSSPSIRPAPATASMPHTSPRASAASPIEARRSRRQCARRHRHPPPRRYRTEGRDQPPLLNP